MNFFNMDIETNSIVGTPMIWIYVVSAMVFTGVTFAFYYWLLQEQDSAIFRRLAPKARIAADWKAPLQGLRQRIASRSGQPPPPGIELQDITVGE
jgi:hypothetical protein